MSKRAVFDYTVPASVMRDNTATVVKAQHTATPGLIVHQRIGAGGIIPKVWNIAHELTGLGADSGYGMGIRKARLLAGAMGGLPVDWTASQEEVQKAVKAFDPIYHEWLRKAGRK